MIYNIGPWTHNGPNKLECCIKFSWKGQPEKNTLGDWALSQVAKKMKCCEYGPWVRIHKTLFSLQLKIEPDKLEYCVKLWQ